MPFHICQVRGNISSTPHRIDLKDNELLSEETSDRIVAENFDCLELRAHGTKSLHISELGNE